MASIKELKNDINLLTYDLINECFTYKMFHPEKSPAADKAISEIVRFRNELIHRVNHPEAREEGTDLKHHFNRIKADLGKLVKLVEELGKDA
jgi:hypothetical protein